jgi:multidrug resistance efflux pump
VDSILAREELRDDFPSMQMVRTGRLVRLAGRLTLIALCAAIVAMFLVPWQQTARGVGTVLALDPQERPQPILSPSEGVISFVEEGIREGSYVEQGQLVLRLTPFAAGGVDQIASQIQATESALAAQKATYEVAKQNVVLQESSGRSLMQSLAQTLEAAKEKWEQSKNDVVVLQAELKDKSNQLRIAEEVVAKGLISREELFTKRQAVEAHYNKTLKAENAEQEAFATLRSKEDELESKREDINIKNREAKQKEYSEEQKVQSIEKNLSELRNKRDEFNRLDVVAPRAGYIQQWYGLAGSDTVKKGDQLFLLVPDTEELAVEMKVSGNDMPLLQVGDSVRLQFEGWPAVQFVGWPSVAVGTFGGKVNRVFPTDDGKGNFRVVVTPDNHFAREDGWPDGRYLRQGVRVNGWVLLKQVPLGYEIWRQLNGFPPIVADQEPGKSKDKASMLKVPKL